MYRQVPTILTRETETSDMYWQVPTILTIETETSDMYWQVPTMIKELKDYYGTKCCNALTTVLCYSSL